MQLFTICLKYFAVISFLIVFSRGPLNSQMNTWFKDVTSQVGIDAPLAANISVVDINNDNYPDILWGPGKVGQGIRYTFRLLLNIEDPENPGKRIFRDVTDESGINKNRNPEKNWRGYEWAVMADLNNDKNMDLISGMYYHRLEWIQNTMDTLDRGEIYLGDGTGKFTLVDNNGLHDLTNSETVAPGIINSTGVSMLDYDMDGITDMYISTWFVDYANDVKMTDILMHGNGDGSFTQVNNSGIQTIRQPMYGVNSTDWNNDGLPDILTSPYCRSGGSLFKNNGNGTFTDKAGMVGYNAQTYGGDHMSDTTLQPMCQWEAITGDYDNDGDIDILHLLVHGGLDAGEGHTCISTNTGPPEYLYIMDLDQIVRNESKSAHLGDYAGVFFDFDNDTWLDLAIAEGHYTPATRRLYICRQNPDNHSFYDVSDSLGLLWLTNASSIQALDYDLDGDEDFLVAYDPSSDETDLKVLLIENEIGNQNNWVSVKLDAPQGCNGNAIGARVIVSSNGVNQIREIQTGLGHFGGQEPFILNFGLGKFNYIDSIKVIWPMKNDRYTTVYNPPTNIILELNKQGLEGFVQNWKGIKPVMSFNMPYMDFDSVDAGSEETRHFEVVNMGTGNLSVENINIQGDTSEYHLIEPPESFVLMPDSSMTLNVKFSPKYRKQFSAEVVFSSDAQNGTIKKFDLRGFGYEPKPIIMFDIYKVKFTGVKEFDTDTVYLRNAGELPLELFSAELENDTSHVFSYSLEIKTLSPGEILPLAINFTPWHRLDYSADIVINSNAYNYPAFKVYIDGNGDVPTPQISLSVAGLIFNAVNVGLYRERELVIENKGDADLIVTDILPRDNADTSFTFPGTEFPFTLLQGENQSVTVHFEPKSVMSYNTSIDIFSNSYPDSIKTMSVIARGTEPQGIAENRIPGVMSARLIPNPVESSSKIVVELSDDSFTDLLMKLYDIQGNMLWKNNCGMFSKGTYEFDFDSGHLSQGVYYLIVEKGTNLLYLPVVVLE